MNMVFNIAICDNDYIFLEKLHSNILNIMSNNGYACNVMEFYNGEELIKYCTKNINDIVMIDINLPNKSGFQTVKEIKKFQPDLKFIFITANEELALQAYDYQPFWFVSKRYLEKLEYVLIKLVGKLEYNKMVKETVYLQSDRLISINTEQVMYIKSNGHYLIQHMSIGEDSRLRYGLQEAYEQLKNFGFICAHRSYIVNCRYIDKINTKGIVLKNGMKLPVSGSKNIIEDAQVLYAKFYKKLI